MRALAIFVIVSCLGADIASAAAQRTSAAVAEEAPVQLVERAERIWAEALGNKDRQRLEGVLDERFQLINVDLPGSRDRDGYLRQLSDANWPARMMTPTSISVSVNGKIAVAVVSMTIDWDFQWYRHWKFIDTWIWADGEWRVVSRVGQAIRIP
jgi:hypothetical protein